MEGIDARRYLQRRLSPEARVMDSDGCTLYLPINCLKQLCADVWIVDGPIVRFGLNWPNASFTTRMTIVRDGTRLFVHSPTELTGDLRRQLDAIGHVTWIVEPNRLHYSWLTSWVRMFRDASVFVAPKVAEKVAIASPMSEMRETHGYPWDKFIRTLPITSSYMTEVEFFHIPSRTLILTDLIENFEPAKLSSAAMRWITRTAGAVAPHGGMPIDMRLTFLGHKAGLRAAVAQLIEWNPARVVIAHGKCFDTEGRAALERAFRWLLPKAVH